jgi:hypothetical protein
LLIELLLDGSHLPAFELAEPYRMPALRGPDHQLQYRFLAEGVGNDLEPPALLDEQPLKKIRNRFKISGADVRLRFSRIVAYGATIRDGGTGSTKVRAGRSTR